MLEKSNKTKNNKAKNLLSLTFKDLKVTVYLFSAGIFLKRAEL